MYILTEHILMQEAEKEVQRERRLLTVFSFSFLFCR